MTRSSPALRLCLLPLLALAGCAGIEITRAPFVMPAPVTTRFQVSAQVVNYSVTASPSILWLKLHAEYWPVPKPAAGQPPCVLDDVLTVGFLAGRTSWALGDYDLVGHQPGKLATCFCLKDQCTGNIDLTLFQGNKPPGIVQLEGSSTSFNFVWIPSGNPDDPHELIRDNSLVPSH